MLLKMLYARKRKLDRIFKKKVNKMNRTKISMKLLKLVAEIEDIHVDLTGTIRAIKAVEKYHIEYTTGLDEAKFTIEYEVNYEN